MAQRLFYERYAPLVLGTCRRYLENDQEAEDAMVQALYKALTRLDTLHSGASLRAWLRRIAVNECLMLLRQRRPVQDWFEDVEERTAGPQEGLQARDLIRLLDRLPTGYRTIFNLYVMEGYRHREIGELLGISIHTSKSQLLQARRKLAAWLGKPLSE